ncbi:MAG: sigma-70 family RNA polymerase sigma factor [Sphingobacteriia bacterium]|nr:sigma-70 family RNA polymerase sigma factor [Sphingobacteriia bacterium]
MEIGRPDEYFFFTFAKIFAAMIDLDYRIWKASSRKFIKLNKMKLCGLVAQKCFLGHLSANGKDEWCKKVLLLMESDEVKRSLAAFSQRGSFMVFYLSHLNDLVRQYSQNEDIHLLHHDFNSLVLKYSPLVKKVIFDLCEHIDDENLKIRDVEQQVLENLLKKKDKIRQLFDGEGLFSNYFWAVIKNESKNLIKAAMKHSGRFVNPEYEFFRMLQNDEVTGTLVIYDAMQLFEDVLKLYFSTTAKLIVCLKIVLKLPVLAFELEALFVASKQKPIVLAEHLPNMESIHNKGILEGFERYQKLLNIADQSETDSASYWRWTNLQIKKMISLINQKHTMTFDRETFSTLAELYFENYYSIEFLTKVSHFRSAY